MTFSEDSPFHILVTSYQLVSKILLANRRADENRLCKMRSTSRGCVGST